MWGDVTDRLYPRTQRDVQGHDKQRRTHVGGRD